MPTGMQKQMHIQMKIIIESENTHVQMKMQIEMSIKKIAQNANAN